MKPLNLLFVGMIMLLTQSCYTTKYTHQEAMDLALLGATKDEIIQGVGLPDSKQVEGAYEQWVYHRGQVIKTSVRPVRTTSNASAVAGSRNLYGDVNSVNVASNSYSFGGSSTSRVYDKYVKLLFKDGVVVSWDSQGVDYSVVEPDTKKTLIATGATIVAAALVILFGTQSGL